MVVRRVRDGVLTAGLLVLLGGCAVGPGTPLLDAMKTEPGRGSADVPAPAGYGAPVGTGNSSGLINPAERRQTEAYLKSLATE
jgi:hypothetical protein